MAGALKIGLYGLHRDGGTNPDRLARRARLAEEAGFESLWVGDHIALPPVTASGEFDPSPMPRLEAVTAIAYLAAVTERVRLGLGVIVVPQRQPVLLAKQLSTLDVLSAGRLIVGVGVGYIEPELRALGVSLGERGARTDEYLAAMRSLWDTPVPSFAGEFVSFSGVVQRPLPVQRPHPSILVGEPRRPPTVARSRPATVGTAGRWTWSRRRGRWPGCAMPRARSSGQPGSASWRSRSHPPARSTPTWPGDTPTSVCTG